MAAWFIVGPLLFVFWLGLLGFLFLRRAPLRVEREEALEVAAEITADPFPPPSHRVVLSRREIREQVEAERQKLAGGKPFLF